MIHGSIVIDGHDLHNILEALSTSLFARGLYWDPSIHHNIHPIYYIVLLSTISLSLISFSFTLSLLFLSPLLSLSLIFSYMFTEAIGLEQ